MFTFKGISTKEMRIIVEEPENLIAKAPLKHEVLNIEGRDDAIYYPLGYAPIEISLTLQLLDPSKIDEVLMWLDGEGELIYKDRKTKARIYSEIQPIRTSGIRIINIEVIRSPFWYDLEDDYSEAWGVNLIPNGWDSFKPHGNVGEETRAPLAVFDDGYSRNFVADSKELKELEPRTIPVDNQFFRGKYVTIMMTATTKNVIHNTGRNRAGAEFSITFTDGQVVYVGAWQHYQKDGEITSSTDTIARTVLIPDKEVDSVVRLYAYHQVEADEIIISNVKVEINDYEKNPVGYHEPVEWVPAWEDLPEKDKPVRAWDNMAVHSQNIGGGLTRIRVKGGKHVFKLVYYNTIPENTTITTSVFFSKLRKPLRITVNNPWSYDNVYSSGCYSLTRTTESPGNINTHIGTFNVDDSLDFIASSPTIVEGDTPPTWEADENPRILNEGTAPSKPLIKLTKGTTNTCEFEVNGVYFKYHFNNDDHVLIDCDKMEASDNGKLRNRHLTIGFEFPVLEPGPNVVKRISGDAKIEFSRKDRWL